jgi:hypothetical protein
MSRSPGILARGRLLFVLVERQIGRGFAGYVKQLAGPRLRPDLLPPVSDFVLGKSAQLVVSAFRFLHHSLS